MTSGCDPDVLLSCCSGWCHVCWHGMRQSVEEGTLPPKPPMLPLTTAFPGKHLAGLKVCCIFILFPKYYCRAFPRNKGYHTPEPCYLWHGPEVYQEGAGLAAGWYPPHISTAQLKTQAVLRLFCKDSYQPGTLGPEQLPTPLKGSLLHFKFLCKQAKQKSH